MELWRIAESCTEVRETEESCVEEARDFETDYELNDWESLVTSFVGDFPKLKMFVFDRKFAEPNSVDYVYKHK